MEKGKTARYLKYAIGEIILVVIGILIALQINNWNQQRIERKEEQAILINLKEDFQTATNEFEWLNDIRSTIISSAKAIMSISPGNLYNYSPKHLDSLFSRTLSGPTYNNQAGSLNVLLTSGKINLISNPTLKKSLIEWPGYVADMTEDELAHLELYLGRYSDLLARHISWNDLANSYDLTGARFNQVKLETMPDNHAVTSDYKALINSKIFINTLNRRATMCMISNSETKVLIKTARSIIEMIDQELK
ncbi:hypothetical protein CA834_10370 [Winogradskyella aurantia]|uniref:Uncharacterized protein n=2 Tax=Winogradskyella aurantia TaxID=1915063 RepID=A0A265URU7_9FLAO|nr:hypothetical protein CA834_10370 [Winogradskyella aurantia]